MVTFTFPNITGIFMTMCAITISNIDTHGSGPQNKIQCVCFGLNQLNQLHLLHTCRSFALIAAALFRPRPPLQPLSLLCEHVV